MSTGIANRTTLRLSTDKPFSYFTKTHYSSIPLFQHSSCERSELSSKVLFQILNLAFLEWGLFTRKEFVRGEKSWQGSDFTGLYVIPFERIDS